MPKSKNETPKKETPKKETPAKKAENIAEARGWMYDPKTGNGRIYEKGEVIPKEHVDKPLTKQT